MVPLRELRAKETHDLIMSTGLAMIMEKGYDAVSVEDITSACGISKGSFYTYFKSKDSMFSSASWSNFIEGFEKDLAARPELDVIGQLRLLETGYWEDVLKYGVNLGRAWLRFNNSPDKTKATTSYEANYEYTLRLLERGVGSGQLSPDAPVEFIARVLIAQRIGVQSLWCSEGGRDDGGAFVERWFEDVIVPFIRPYIVG